MLDVLHYLLDDDLSYLSGEQAEYKSSMRESLYKHLYEEKYKYAYSPSHSQSNNFDYDNDKFAMPSNTSNEVKPYMPPTNFDPDSANPFQGALREQPLG